MLSFISLMISRPHWTCIRHRRYHIQKPIVLCTSSITLDEMRVIHHRQIAYELQAKITCNSTGLILVKNIVYSTHCFKLLNKGHDRQTVLKRHYDVNSMNSHSSVLVYQPVGSISNHTRHHVVTGVWLLPYAYPNLSICTCMCVSHLCTQRDLVAIVVQ